jgi:transcriptional regulator with XRE-family HTH domain
MSMHVVDGPPGRVMMARTPDNARAGQILSALRSTAQLSQQELCEILSKRFGFTLRQSILSTYESGTHQVPAAVLVAVTEYTGGSIDEYLQAGGSTALLALRIANVLERLVDPNVPAVERTAALDAARGIRDIARQSTRRPPDSDLPPS